MLIEHGEPIAAGPRGAGGCATTCAGGRSPSCRHPRRCVRPWMPTGLGPTTRRNGVRGDRRRKLGAGARATLARRPPGSGAGIGLARRPPAGSRARPCAGAGVDRAPEATRAHAAAAGQRLQGRVVELGRLRLYVDMLPLASVREALSRGLNRVIQVFRDRPPLVIHGPGGSGKSTLIAKLIGIAGPGVDAPSRSSTSTSTGPPVAHEPRLSARRGTEADRRAIPGHGAEAKRVAAAEPAARCRRSRATSRGALTSSNRAIPQGRDLVLDRLSARERGGTGKARPQNVLLVFDTFEVVQRRGASAAFGVLRLAATFIEGVSRLRVVIAGRGVLRPSDFSFTDETPTWEPLPLEGFDASAGRAYLRGRLGRARTVPLPDDTLERVVKLVRGNPLGLRLAAEVLRREGLEGVQDALRDQLSTPSSSRSRSRACSITASSSTCRTRRSSGSPTPGSLSGASRSSSSRRCSRPPAASSLTMRRPLPRCSPACVRRWRWSSRRTHTLSGTRDVRRMDAAAPAPQARRGGAAIDELTVQHWQGRTGPTARAEELYHRLWLGQDAGTLDARWTSEAGPLLDDALDELEDLDGDPAARSGSRTSSAATWPTTCAASPASSNGSATRSGVPARCSSRDARKRPGGSSPSAPARAGLR